MTEAISPPISARTGLKVALMTAVALVVVSFVITGMPAVVGAEESFVVLSGSMAADPEPVIQPGDVVIVDGIDPARIEEGDVITYRTGGEPVTHRVVDVQSSDGTLAFRTQGDANDDPDVQLVRQDQVIGEVTFVVPYIGYVVLFANTPEGFVLLVVLPLGLVVASEVWNTVWAGTPAGSNPGTGDAVDEPGAGEPPVAAASGAGVDGQAGENPETGESTGDVDPDASTVSLKRHHLAGATFVCLVVAAVAGYIAFERRTAWAFTAFYAAVGFFLLCGGLSLRMSGVIGESESGDTVADVRAGAEGGRSPGGPTGSEDVVGDRIVTGSIRSDLDERDRVVVEVAEPSTLVAMAREDDTWVVDATDADGYYLVTEGTVFRAPEPEDETTADDETGKPVEDRVIVPDETAEQSVAPAANGGPPSGGEDGSSPAGPDEVAPVEGDATETGAGESETDHSESPGDGDGMGPFVPPGADEEDGPQEEVDE